MATDKAELEAQRGALVKALRSGALHVKHGDKAVTYRSMAEIERAIDDIDSELGKKRKRVLYINAKRGY